MTENIARLALSAFKTLYVFHGFSSASKSADSAGLRFIFFVSSGFICILQLNLTAFHCELSTFITIVFLSGNEKFANRLVAFICEFHIKFKYRSYSFSAEMTLTPASAHALISLALTFQSVTITSICAAGQITFIAISLNLRYSASTIFV